MVHGHMELAIPSFQFRFMKALGNVIFPANFHPVGSQRSVQQMLSRAFAAGAASGRTDESWLIVGGSGGFGTAARLAAAATLGAHTLNLSFDAEPNLESGNKIRRIGSPAFHRNLRAELGLRERGLTATTLNGDVFQPEIRDACIAKIRSELPGGKLRGLVWSLAAPRAFDPRTGETVNSVLKPIGLPATVRTFSGADANTESEVQELEIAPGTPAEAVATQYVMGGAIVEHWINALLKADVLAEGFRLLTISYRGSPLNEAIYHKGMIGLAKAELEFTTKALSAVLARSVQGSAYCVEGPAVVTEASGGIPGVPFYMALLCELMGDRFEDPLDSMMRLFRDHLAPGREPQLDAEGLIRMDDRELEPGLQAQLKARFDALPPGATFDRALHDAFLKAYSQTRGFAIEGVDYDATFDVDAVNRGEC